MSTNGANVARPEALESDHARRIAAARAIAGFLAAVSVMLVVQTLILDAPRVAASEAAGAAAYAAVWWASRKPRFAPMTATGVVATLIAQTITASALSTSVVDGVHVAYFIGLGAFITAATMKPRGVALSGLALGAALAAQIAFHVDGPTFDALEPFTAAIYFFLVTWVVALVTSFASQRAVEAHARDEARSIAAREAAREAESRYRLVAEHMSDLISVVDLEGKYLFASPSHERVLGVPPASLLGRVTSEIVHPDDFGPLTEAFARLGRASTAAVVGRIRTAGGAYRWFHLSFSRIEYPSARDGAIAISARDITDVQELSEALEATRRMEALGRLAGGVAHDFNNLLLVIQSCADFATARLTPDHPAKKDLEDIRQATERGAAITGQLLTFARRQVMPPAERSSVAAVVREIEPILARIGGHEIRLEVDADPSSTTLVDATPVQLEQVLINFASNARDAMPEGGALRIRVRDEDVREDDASRLPPGRYVRLEVTDTGVGMSDEVRSRIFEPFFTTKAPGRGTGLGLSTVFGLTSQLGGLVDVRSAPGAGTTFIVMLPESRAGAAADTPASPEQAASEAEVVPERPRALRVLVVEDEPPIRSLIARALGAAGHRPTEAGDIEQAIAISEAERSCFDAIVTDVVLGSGDGIAMLDRVRAAQPNAAILVVSGFSPSPERVAAVRERGAEFLAKPFGASDLLAALGRARSRVRTQ